MNEESRKSIIATLLEEKIVAVVRLSSDKDALPVAEALLQGGVRIIEMTMTTPGATELIMRIREQIPGAIVGAGSVLTRADVDQSLSAGAEFLVGPVLDLDILAYAIENNAAFCPGIFTPSEAYAAWKRGAPLVKVFPAARVGSKFIADLKAPMPFLKLMPTGGISAESVGEFLAAGADVVGAGSWLTPRAAIEARKFDVITQRASQLRQAVRKWQV